MKSWKGGQKRKGRRLAQAVLRRVENGENCVGEFWVGAYLAMDFLLTPGCVQAWHRWRCLRGQRRVPGPWWLLADSALYWFLDTFPSVGILHDCALSSILNDF